MGSAGISWYKGKEISHLQAKKAAVARRAADRQRHMDRIKSKNQRHMVCDRKNVSC